MKNALQLIAAKMQSSANLWLLEGETGLVLQGVAIPSRSIRIITDRLGAFALGEHLKGFGSGIQTRRDGQAISYHGAYKLFDVPVEIIGDWIIAYNNYKVTIPVAEISSLHCTAELGEYLIPVVPLEWQLFIDLLLGKDRKHLLRIVAEEVEHAKVSALIERFGLLTELKDRIAEIF